MVLSYSTHPLTEQRHISVPSLSFLWLEITGMCNLACAHCYAGSSPQGTHGRMVPSDWERVILQAASLGCKHVQFIGGEPTVYPSLPQLIRLAVHEGMNVEVYTNLVSIKPELWDIFRECHVHIATSFYSVHPTIHEKLTHGKGNFAKTVDNMARTVALGLPLRVGIIEMHPDQDVKETEQYIRNLGISRVSRDRVRSVGRGKAYIQVEDPRNALCGACARGKVCVVPSGDVYPCVFSRWLKMGNVVKTPLRDIITGDTMTQTRQQLTLFFLKRDQRRRQDPCTPDNDACAPEATRAQDPCTPDNDACTPELARMQSVFPCMPETEHYLKTQDLSTLLRTQIGCEPYECNPNCEPGQSGCNPDNQGCPPTNLCVPDFKDPCPPAQPCPPDRESCPPEWDENN